MSDWSVMNAFSSTGDKWILGGIAYLLFRIVGRVETVEKAVEKLVEDAKKPSNKSGFVK